MRKRLERKRDRDYEKRPRFGEGRVPILRKRRCKFCLDKSLNINYLDHQLLHKFITERGKIISSKFSGTCARHQRKLACAVKRARTIGLLPFLAE